MTKNIGTHDGKFHADEVLACVLLQMTKEFSSAKIIRTRDESILKGMDVIVDVGGMYDPNNHRYDHHQPTFNDTFSPRHKTLLSSAGLIYKHFAKEIIESSSSFSSISQDRKEAVDTIYNKIYDAVIEAFDAHDNGISAYPSSITPAYHHPWNIFDQVNILNPAWNDDINVIKPDDRFGEALELMRNTFKGILGYYCETWYPGKTLTQCLLTTQRMTRREEISDDDRLLILDQYCPWMDHLFELEKELEIPSPILYAIYQDSNKRSWRVNAVPRTPDSFECRLALPAAWRGLRDVELDEMTGIPGGVFVHRTGFIGGHKTREGAIAMALKSIELHRTV